MGPQVKRKILAYVLIFIFSLIFLLTAPSTIADFILSFKSEGKKIKEDLKEGYAFVEKRSQVTYKLERDEPIERLVRLFGLKLSRKAIVKLNPELQNKNIISRGTTVRLYIQSK